jgi:hypothetical protein
MNLAEMRDMVGSIVDYDPNVQTYRDEVTRILNELYLDFFTDRPWKFSQETEEIQVYKDVEVTDGVIAVGANTITSASTPFLDWMEGNIVEIKGATASADNNEWVIAKSTTGVLYLEGFSGTNAETITAVIKQRFIDMPEDCNEVLSIGIRSPIAGTQAHFDYLSRARDEEYSLLLSSTGLPTDWLIYDDVTMTQPVLQPTLAADAAGTTWSEIGTYYVQYTFVHKNKESAPSPVASVASPTSGNWKLDLTNVQNTGTNSGMFKRFYLRTTTNSAFYQVSNADIDETTLLINNLNVAVDYLANARRLPENDGHYKRVRLYPRQDTDYLVEVRFVYRPDRLIEDTDVPEFPPAHHRYLVYRACQELFVKHDNLQHSELYRRKADTELLRLENTYLSEGAGVWIKQGYRESQVRWGTQTSLTHRG